MKKILFLLFALSSLTVLAQQNKMVAIDLGNNEDFAGFEILNQQLEGCKLIITGEQANYTGFNTAVELKMLRYLHGKGIRQLAQDISPSKAYIINQYINSNDSIWKTLMLSNSGTSAANLYENIRDWNMDLPDSQRIEIKGLDIEKNHVQLVLALHAILPTLEIPDDIRIGVEAMHSAGKYIIEKNRNMSESEEPQYIWGRSNITSTMLSLFEFLKFYDSLQPQFMNWLDTNYAAVHNIVNGIREYKTWRNYNNTAFKYTWREEMMYLRLRKTLEANKKTYLQLEQCHLANSRKNEACDFYKFSSIIHKMQSDILNKNEILSIGIFYKNEYSITNNLTSEVSDEHAINKPAILPLFQKMDDYSASFIDPDSNVNCNTLSANYSIILLNNNYPSADADEMDKTDKKIDKNNQNNAAIYVGFTAYNSTASATSANTQLKNAGLQTINSMSSYGVSIQVVGKDDVFQRFYFGGARNYSSNYSNFRIEYGGGFAPVVTKHFKLISNVDMGYVVHNISIDTGQTSNRFIADNSIPLTYTNPSFYMGYNIHTILDLGPFFIFGSVGGVWDFGDSRWQLNKQYTGEAGRLSNRGWTYGYGGGLTIPFIWFEK